MPVRERAIPKRGGNTLVWVSRRSGTGSSRWPSSSSWSRSSRADFYPSSYGYRPGRRAQDAIAEIVHFTQAPSDYEWVIEADIEACFDRLSHCLILGEVRRRIEDKRVLVLMRAFLKAGVMTETGRLERTVTGTPQGGIISPLLANIALSALDRQYEADWQEMSRYQGSRQYLHRQGRPTYRLVRFADDLVRPRQGDARAGAGAARRARATRRGRSG